MINHQKKNSAYWKRLKDILTNGNMWTLLRSWFKQSNYKNYELWKLHIYTVFRNTLFGYFMMLRNYYFFSYVTGLVVTFKEKESLYFRDILKHLGVKWHDVWDSRQSTRGGGKIDGVTDETNCNDELITVIAQW